MASEFGLEAGGVNLIKRAVELDRQKRFTESLICYQEGIQILMQVMKESAKTDPARAAILRKKVTECMDRAEAIKAHVETQKTVGNYTEQICIKDSATGFSYESILSRFLKESCKSVEIDDPYVRSHHQIVNFLRFCEVLVKSKCSLQVIKLKTGRDANDPSQQTDKLGAIADSLQAYGIRLEVEFSHSLHDREIRLSNNWIIKIGRGLDYFKPPEGRFAIGLHDYDLRKCHETTIDVIYKISV